MSIKYDDNFVKKPGEELEYTQEMVDDLERCSTDFYHFLRHVKILHPDEGRITFVPRGYQLNFLDLVLENRFVIGNWSRQSGKTTCIGTYVLWYAMFHPDKYIGIGSNSAKSAQDFLSRIKMSYEECPQWLKCGVKKYNELSIEFENGSVIQTAATSKNAFRGRTCNILVLDEFAHLISDRLCLSGDSIVKVRDKKTGEIQKIKISELYNLL